MESPVIDGTISEKRHSDAVGFEEFEAVARAGGLKNARADDAAGPHHADFRREQVHAAAATMRTARGAPQQFRDQLPGRNALRQSVPVTTMRAENNVLRTQVGRDPRRDRLLTDISMTCPVNQAALVQSRQLLLAHPYQLHL